MLYTRFISQLKSLAYILGGLLAIIIAAIVFNFYTNAEIDKHHELLNQLSHISASHSEYALRYIIYPQEGVVPPSVEECELGQFLLNYNPTGEELVYFNKVKASHDNFHAELERSSSDRQVYLTSQQLSYELGEYIKFQELQMQQIESTELSRLLAILFVSLLVAIFYFTRFVIYMCQRVVVPLENSIKILRKRV